MAISIQFEGIDDVVNALKNRDCPNWGLFQGRQFLFKSRPGNTIDESTALLEEILQSLVNNPVIYTLKVYEGDDVKINEKAICDGSFNFKVIDEEQLYERKERRLSYKSGSNGQSRMDIIEQKLDRLLDDENNDDENNAMTGAEQRQNWDRIIMGYVENPNKLQDLFNALKSGQGLLTGENMLPANIGNILKLGQNEAAAAMPAPGSSVDLSQEQNILRVSAALDILQRNDPKIIEHLEKLAKLSAENPGTFNMAIKMLEGM